MIDSALLPHTTLQSTRHNSPGIKSLAQTHHTSIHLYLNAESNFLNTYKKQWCKKYNSFNEKYTGKPTSKYKIFNSKAWRRWYVRWIQKWRKLNCWSTMWALAYYKHEKNRTRPSYSTKEVSRSQIRNKHLINTQSSHRPIKTHLYTQLLTGVGLVSRLKADRAICKWSLLNFVSS